MSERLSEVIDTLIEANEYLISSVRSGEITEETTEVFSACQEMAIGIGESIEENAIDCEKVIAELEGYCECVYQTHAGEKPVTELGLWNDRLKVLAKNVLREKREVVFLVCHGSWWKQGYQSLYEEMISRDDTRVTGIAVPLYERNVAGEIMKESLTVDTEGMPENVVLTPYEEYSFPDHLPDEVYIQTPMDEYEVGMSVHPFFYSSSICKYTKKLIFVTPFYFREADSIDGRIGYTLSQYICKPGTLYADEVIVQSEAMAKLWCGMWERFMAEESEVEGKQDGKKSVDVSDAVRKQQDLRHKLTWDRSPVMAYRERTRAEQRQAEGEKRVLIYYVSGSVLYEHGKRMIEKMRKTLAFFAEHRDELRVIWCLDPYAEEILKNYSPEVLKGFSDILTGMSGGGTADAMVGGCIQVVEAYDIHELAAKCDGIYGDGGVLMNACREAGKKVLLEMPGTDGLKQEEKVFIETVILDSASPS